MEWIETVGEMRAFLAQYSDDTPMASADIQTGCCGGCTGENGCYDESFTGSPFQVASVEVDERTWRSYGPDWPRSADEHEVTGVMVGKT